MKYVEAKTANGVLTIRVHLDEIRASAREHGEGEWRDKCDEHPKDRVNVDHNGTYIPVNVRITVK